MRQRLGIAAALLADPRVLLFDEPVDGLDLDGVRWIRALLRRLADEGRTVLVSSHLLGEVPGMTQASSVTALLGWAGGALLLGWARLARDDANR